ncbi:MAG: nucleotidyltransferase [Candidatus Staskawiczbacteria bacterium]
MENAEAAVKKAIANHKQLSEMDISIFAQGSYRTNTSVKQDSDVDICVRLNSTFFSKYPEGKTRENYGNIEGSIKFAEYKNLIQEALNDYFGLQYVSRGNKAFDVHSNSYRVDADVVPAFAYRYYYGDGENDYIDPVGMAFLTDRGVRIENWPHQVHNNGISKQDGTSQRYKKVVRILKKLRNKMQEENIVGSQDVASFLIECMVWNVPDNSFGKDDYHDDVRAVLANCFNYTLKDEACKDFCEVNDIKYLFHSSQPWNREKAHGFFNAAWDYIGFK